MEFPEVEVFVYELFHQVLDIEDAAPRPGRASALVLRRADPRRASTQAWRLHAGRLACAHRNLCAQPEGASRMALVAGARVVLALSAAARSPTAPADQVHIRIYVRHRRSK